MTVPFYVVFVQKYKECRRAARLCREYGHTTNESISLVEAAQAMETARMLKAAHLGKEEVRV